MESCILKLNEIGAIKFGEFTLKSGILSPIYIDLRILIAYPKFLETVADMMWDAVSDESYDQICGVPYTALPIATIVSLKQNIPMLIKRKEQKGYGTKKQVEGKWKTDDSCLLIEDVIVSGSSVLETIEVLKKDNLTVKQTIVFIDRQQGGRANLEREGVKIKSVLTLDQVVNVLLANGKIEVEVAEKVRNFIKCNSSVPIPVAGNADSSKCKAVSVRRLPLQQRTEMAQHPVAKKLLKIMYEKRTNLCVAADVDSMEHLLNIADNVGPHICILKTHVDILNDFTLEGIDELKKKAAHYNFLIMEDRKFADIGKTVQSQYAAGMHKIAKFADLVTVHGVSGHGIITGLKSVANEFQAAVLVAEMSSKGNLCDDSYTKGCVAMAKENTDFVIGFVAQSAITTESWQVIMTPGVSLRSSSDSMGQQYKSPADAIQRGADVIIVGRAITSNDDVTAAAKEYKDICFSLLLENTDQ